MRLLDRLPISAQRNSLRFGHRYTTVHRGQALMWVSVNLIDATQSEENIRKFPALIDTGNNFDFVMQERQLREWAGIDPGLLAVLGDIEINRRVVSRHMAGVSLYPNVPGRQEPDIARKPFPLKMDQGIALYTQGAHEPSPRLPLLGLPAFLANDLDLWLDPERRHITVHSGNWRRPLIRLLCRL